MPRIKTKKKESVKPNKTEMENKQLEFYRVKNQRKTLEKREAELKPELDRYMQDTLEPSDKGHYLFSTVDEKGNKIHLQKQARKKIELNEERAQEYLEENGFTEIIREREVIAPEVTEDQILDVLAKHAPHLLDHVKYVDQDELSNYVNESKVPMRDFEEMCDTKINYAMTFIDDEKLQEEKAEQKRKEEEAKQQKIEEEQKAQKRSKLKVKKGR